MAFSKRFFDIQFSFAERVRAMSGVPLDRALFDYTNFYVRFGLGRQFNFDHETWQAYLAGLRNAEDGRDWTYRFYLKNAEATTEPPLVDSFGCFSYALPKDSLVRLHFRNAEADECSPLGGKSIERRRADLTALFKHVRQRVGEEAVVAGVSWLYNLDAYRCLFPAEYIASARVVRGRFRSMSLWGQFLDHCGDVKETIACSFLGSLSRQSTLADVDECFPFQVLTVHAPVTHFYNFYEIQPVANGRPTSF